MSLEPMAKLLINFAEKNRDISISWGDIILNQSTEDKPDQKTQLTQRQRLLAGFKKISFTNNKDTPNIAIIHHSGDWHFVFKFDSLALHSLPGKPPKVDPKERRHCNLALLLKQQYMKLLRESYKALQLKNMEQARELKECKQQISKYKQSHMTKTEIEELYTRNAGKLSSTAWTLFKDCKNAEEAEKCLRERIKMKQEQGGEVNIDSASHKTLHEILRRKGCAPAKLSR